VTDPARLPLLGLLADAIVPGETHEIVAGALDPATFAAIRRAKPKRLLALAVRTSAELPSFVTGRVGTACRVERIDKDGVLLAGVERARVVRAFAGTPPHAIVEPGPAESSAMEVVDALAGLLAARPTGAATAASDVLAAARALLRAVAPQASLRAAMDGPIAAALAGAAEAMSSAGAAAEIRARLDALRPAAGATLSDEDKRELAAHVATLQRDLDLLPKLEGGDAMHGDIVALERKLDAAALPAEALDLARRQLGALRGMHKAHHDYPTVIAHVELMAALPWSGPLSPMPAFDALEAALDAQHHGLARPKKRILEYLAVRALGGAARGVVLCLAGPPGTGKTSLARSIADGLGRKFVRVSLGGVHDEAEIRGHRRAFTNAGPGRILRGMRGAPRDPVMLLDEIDKIGKDSWRSPSAALLEVLDPEQNHAFGDNFLGCPFDLSSVLFITTANDPGDIMPALRDRLELVELEGYTTPEKIAIAVRHVLPRVRKDVGLPGEPPIDERTIERAITGWTREAGVRELQRVLAAVHRDRAVRHLRGDAAALTAPIVEDEIVRVAGRPRHRDTAIEKDLRAGRVYGLSVGPEGGAVLPVEVLATDGRGKLRLTGQQGDVMRESAAAARTCVRARAGALGLREEGLARRDLHVHLPEAAVKKDGPSAGLATFLAMVSALTGRRARADVAVTGEITLHGAVLPVGGVRAKLLAAERAGLARVVLPADNAADVPDDARVERVLVQRVEEALDAVLEPLDTSPARAATSHA
jgi:ATP-dependent Lon protease